ncbi:MAG TPA: serine hydrolase [Chryseolinea sp.]|nr:serine hydrolase [Chryseolinea sp.]
MLKKINRPIRSIFPCTFFLFYTFLSPIAFAHNGVTALVYPVKNIKVDGDLADWVSVKKYPLALTPSDVKPTSGDDFSAFFMIGYNLVDKSLYVAIEVTDNDYVSDTTKQVAWNTQDGLQLYFDVRHLADGSGVVSYLYSETRKIIDSNKWDVGSKGASWNTVEVKMKRNGAKRFYEWKVYIGDALQPGRTIGFDMTALDKDADGFGWNEWGPGGGKYQDSNVLSDIILMKEKEVAGVVNGTAKMISVRKGKGSAHLKFISTTSPQMWVTTVIDSLGKYALLLPQGSYSVALAEKYVAEEKKVYEISISPIANVRVKANATVNVPPVTVTVSEAPDLMPEKGILLWFNSQSPQVIDQFIETYQKYYKIPAVSLALIKDGNVVYHKAYGVKNSFTKEPVNDSTLFEAASITKPVFSYAVQRLAERGLIDLDKPLYEYLPYKDIEYDDRYKLITGRHVLTHRTGFPNWREGKLVINFTPGTKYSYSGEGMQYLQAVIEKITGKGIEQVLKEEVLDPLGMHHTFFSNNDRLMKLVSAGHYNNIPSSDDPTPVPGMAYSMHTEALEFTKFVLQLLEQKGLSAATYKNMLSERSPYVYEDGEEKPKYNEYMGESLGVRDSPFGLVFGHGGNNGDFRCQFEVYKESKNGFAIFTNSSTAYPLLDKMKYFLVEGREIK